MLKCFLALLVLLIASEARAQVATQVSKLGFTEVGQSVANASLATYKLYLDNSPTGVVGANLICAAGTPITDSDCSVSFPALTLGQHTVTVTQSFGTTESVKSPSFTFQFVVVVVPSGLKIVGDDELDSLYGDLYIYELASKE